MEAMRPMSHFEKSLQNAKQECDSAINQGLNSYCYNPAIVLKVTGERRFVEYKHRFCGEQSSDYSLGKCRYLYREGCKDQLYDRKQEQEADQEKYKYRQSRNELAVEPSADRANFAQDTVQCKSSPSARPSCLSN